jgi:hypothetical protein
LFATLRPRKVFQSWVTSLKLPSQKTSRQFWTSIATIDLQGTRL